jgi:DNA-binding CsgD family transcriptional regulator
MEKTIRSIQRICAAGLGSIPLRRELARRVATVVPHDAYAFSTCDPDTGLMSHTVAERVPTTLARTYVERLYPHITAIEAIDMVRHGRSVFSMVDASPEVGHAFRSHGIAAQIHMSLGADQRLWGTWCVMRAKERGRGLERSVAFLERVTPMIARGLRAAVRVDQAHATTEPGDVASTGMGVVVIDRRGRAITRTAAATRWLRDLADSGLDAPDDLPLSVLGLAARLRRTRSDIPEEMTVRMRGASGRWYSLYGSLTEPNDSGASAVVIVVRPAMRREVASILTNLYALSEREREVVAAVARGEPTKCIAASLGVSAYTVQEHLERACRKIGVRGRKALVAKLFVDGYAPTILAQTAGGKPPSAVRSA